MHEQKLNFFINKSHGVFLALLLSFA